MEILHLKLKKDLLKLALEYYNEGDESGEGDEEEFKEWVTQRINSYITDKNIEFSFTNETRVDPMKCSARIWDNGKGEKQCTHKIKEGCYCKKHHEMIKREGGVLRFGDIRDKRPTHDLIKLKNGEIEKLHWIDPNQLQSVLNQQQRKVILSTPKLIVD